MSDKYTKVVEFNTYLSINLSNLSLKDYFNKYHLQFNQGANSVDISFMDYFLYLCKHKGEFVVEQEKLKEYGIINSLTTSFNIKRSLEQFDLVENEDYRLLNVEQPVVQGGFSIKKLYTLTPTAFKLCLIRAKNSKKYAKYYLLLEEVVDSYNEYEKLCKENLLKMKDNRIDELSKKVDDLLKYAKETKETLEETKETLEETNDKLDEAVDKIEENSEKLEDIKEAFEETANRSVPDPDNEKDNHEFVLLQSLTNAKELKFMRGMISRNERIIKKNYANYNIIKRDYNANPIQLFKMFKETMKKKYKIEKQAISANKSLKNKVELKKAVVQ